MQTTPVKGMEDILWGAAKNFGFVKFVEKEFKEQPHCSPCYSLSSDSWGKDVLEGGADLCPLGSSNRTHWNGSNCAWGSLGLKLGSIFLLRWSRTGGGFLEGCLIPQAYQSLGSICTMPLILCFGFWSALKWLNSWTLDGHSTWKETIFATGRCWCFPMKW